MHSRIDKTMKDNNTNVHLAHKTFEKISDTFSLFSLFLATSRVAV